MEFNVPNYDEVEKEVLESRKPAPAGVYQMRVDSYEVKTSEKGNQYIAWVLVITNNTTTPEVNGKKVFHNTPVSGSGASFLLDFAKATGIKWEGTKFDPNRYIGATLTANLKIETYQDKEKNVVKSFC